MGILGTKASWPIEGKNIFPVKNIQDSMCNVQAHDPVGTGFSGMGSLCVSQNSHVPANLGAHFLCLLRNKLKNHVMKTQFSLKKEKRKKLVQYPQHREERDASDLWLDEALGEWK